MRTETMEDVLRLLDRKVQSERRKIIVFLDNAPCRPETLQNNLKNIKLIFLSKCTTSRLLPLAQSERLNVSTEKGYRNMRSHELTKARTPQK